MPWKVSCKMEEREKFVRRILDGDKMTDLCKEFEISRKTGYKIYNRFMELGKVGLSDESKRPKTLGNLIDSGVAKIILDFKAEKPTWGAPKLRELLIRKYSNLKPPAISTIHALLARNGLVEGKKRRSGFKSTGTYLSNPQRPNDLWCTDFKGEFALGNKSLCYPLTITDQVSRYILEVEAMERINQDAVITSFRRVFREFGMPTAIRSDNGTPFASRAIFGLSKLSVFWLTLGIKLEKIVPGNPQQNGRHERMHRTLKDAVTKPPGKNILCQQEKFDGFINEFNTERPHQSLLNKVPSDIYRKSQKSYPQFIEVLQYPKHDKIFKVSKCGHIFIGGAHRKVFISSALTNQTVGVKEVETGIWTVTFMDYDLGFFDDQSRKFTSGENPFTLIEI